MFSGGIKLGSPDTSGVTRCQSRICFVDCKGILTPILRTWVKKSTLLLQNRGHEKVLKKTPSSAKYVTKVRPPSVPECPPPPPPRPGIVSISNKQGISVDPLMWPISQVMWRELLVASLIYISLRLLWLFRVMEGGGKREGGGKEILWIELKLILALFYSNSSSLWLINYPLIIHLMFILKFSFLKILCNLWGGGTPWLKFIFLISKSPAHQWICIRIQTRAVHGGLLVNDNIHVQ